MITCIDHGGNPARETYRLVWRYKAHAHRVAYAKAHGLTLDETKGLTLYHLCNNKRCINPDHIFATKGRGYEDLLPLEKAREEFGPTGLTQEQIDEIEANCDEPDNWYTGDQLKPFIYYARKFGTTLQAVREAFEDARKKKGRGPDMRNGKTPAAPTPTEED